MVLKISNRQSGIIEFIYKYLWVFVLLPKEWQFVVYGILGIYMLVKRPVKLDWIGVMIGLGLVVQMFAVLFQCLFNNPDVIRVLASVNTIGIWVIGILFYLCAYKGTIEQDKNILSTIAKYLTVNMMILFTIFLIYKVTSIHSVNLFGNTYFLSRRDYLSTGTTTRFCGLMESVLCISHMFCFAFPLSLIYVREWRSDVLKLLYCIMSYSVVYESHSRIGTIVCFVILIIGIIYLLYSSEKTKKIINKKNLSFLGIFLICCVVTWVVINSQEIYTKIISYFMSRKGSNTARFYIYSKSIEKVLEESPIIGVGIKYMLGDFPYGSHSTYIGLLYKAGILGGGCFVLGFVLLYINLYKRCKNDSLKMAIFLGYLCYLGLLVFADFDGNNWVLISWFGIWGCIMRQWNTA